MNRLYVVESARTTTGNMADHRLRLPAGDIERYAYALAAELAKQGVALGPEVTASISKKAASTDGIPPKWLTAVAKDLASNRARGSPPSSTPSLTPSTRASARRARRSPTPRSPTRTS
jgi:molybdopterin-containing oxidoreductase family iron-sulfur binding subunit